MHPGSNKGRVNLYSRQEEHVQDLFFFLYHHTPHTGATSFSGWLQYETRHCWVLHGEHSHLSVLHTLLLILLLLLIFLISLLFPINCSYLHLWSLTFQLKLNSPNSPLYPNIGVVRWRVDEWDEVWSVFRGNTESENTIPKIQLASLSCHWPHLTATDLAPFLEVWKMSE